jgi:hypothetical protein
MNFDKGSPGHLNYEQLHLDISKLHRNVPVSLTHCKDDSRTLHSPREMSLRCFRKAGFGPFVYGVNIFMGGACVNINADSRRVRWQKI